MVEQLAEGLAAVRERDGRLFILGVGGSAGHASHAVNDFRKICDFEAYTPTDNVSELTARTNDEGWDTTFAEWLKGSRLSGRDALLIFSVGGGNAEKGVSTNLVAALRLARERGTPIFGVVGRDGGTTAQLADACVVIPPLYADHITPHTEGLCAVVWHLLVSHPALARTATRWESLRSPAIHPGGICPHGDAVGVTKVSRRSIRAVYARTATRWESLRCAGDPSGRSVSSAGPDSSAAISPTVCSPATDAKSSPCTTTSRPGANGTWPRTGPMHGSR